MGGWVCFVSWSTRVWAAATFLETRKKAWSCHQRANFSTLPPRSASPPQAMSGQQLSKEHETNRYPEGSTHLSWHFLCPLCNSNNFKENIWSQTSSWQSKTIQIQERSLTNLRCRKILQVNIKPYTFI